MAITIPSSLAKFNTRSIWLSLTFLIILLWTFAHLNFNSEPLTSHTHKSAQISYSHPTTTNDEEPPSRAGLPSHKPSFTELASSPLKIYIPPEIPTDDPLLDIWATPYHTEAEKSAADDHSLSDKEAYYKALNCPICQDELQAFDISNCPNIEAFNGRVEESAAGVRGDCPVQPFDVTLCPNIKDLNNRPQGQKPPPAPNFDPGSPPLLSPIDTSELLRKDRPLISYVYTESPAAHKNLAFFINHALHDAADFIFILNGATKVDTDLLPSKRANINIFHLKPKPRTQTGAGLEIGANSCFSEELSAHVEIIGKEGEAGRQSLKNMYSRFILMGAGVRGPFIPRWSGECWSEALLARVGSGEDGKVKLVGTGLSCRKGMSPFVNTGIMAMNKEGLMALIAEEGGEGCLGNEAVELGGEAGVTRRVRDAGFEVGVLDGRWRSESEYRYIECTKDEEWFRGIGIGKMAEEEEIDPWEMLFVSADGKGESPHGHGSGKLEVLSKRVGKSGYSSYMACGE